MEKVDRGFWGEVGALVVSGAILAVAGWIAKQLLPVFSARGERTAFYVVLVFAGVIYMLFSFAIARYLVRRGTADRRSWGFRDLIHPWKTHELEAQLAKRDAALKQHTDAMTYGVTRFDPAPLSSLDSRFLNQQMSELRPLLVEAANRLQVLMSTLTNRMQQYGTGDARYWLAEEIEVRLGPILRANRDRFETESIAGNDSRQALAGFLKYYEESRRWAGRMAEFLNIKLDVLPEWKQWSISNSQLVAAMSDIRDLPQLKALNDWMEWSAHSELLKVRPSGLP